MMIKLKTLQQVVTMVFVLTLPVHSFAGRQHAAANVHVDIITDQRGLIQQFDAGSQAANTERRYIAARHDERYRIRISNPGNKRIGVVIAVDGRNIISGKKSHLSANERMYVLNPYQTQEFDGWRTGKNRINRFYFTGMSDSYAAHWGDKSAMGVVAVAVFNERHQKIHGKKHGKGKGGHPGKFRNGKMRQFSSQHREAPGTGFGEGEWSPSKKVHFAAQKRPVRKVFIKYEWRRTLCRMGVIQCRPRNQRHAENYNRFWPDDRSRNRHDRGFAPFPIWFSFPGF